MNEQTLELQIKSKAQEAKTSVESLVKSLTNVENVLTNIYLELGHIEKKTGSTINKTTNITKNINQIKQSSEKATDSANKMGTALKSAFTFAGVKRITRQMLGWVDEAVNYTEQLNLFNVVFNNIEKDGVKTFSRLGTEATKFQNKLNEKFGTNKTETLYMQGIYQSMGETVGIQDKYSAIMSETMTKLTYDLASLYNKGEEATAEALRAGVYAGQTKPLRSFGIDVTQNSMQPILDSLGIDEQVKNLSQAEKEILRYLATLKQAKIAMGDFANNLESPANQMKIFKQQLVETKVALSSLFIGTFAKFLPYANAVLMVIKEISNAIATMFGIELTDYNTGIASQEGIYDGIEDSADDASKAVKKLKRQVFGFDEIHNIDENKDSDNGTNVGGGIDQRLLDAIKGYDNGMDKVRMKATEIRDKIMEWLGFTKEIDPLTGKVSFKYGGIKKTLANMWKSFKGISTEGKVLIGLGLVIGAEKLLSTGKKLITVFGTSGLYKSLKLILSPFKLLGTNMLNLIQYTKIYTKLSGNLNDGLQSGIEAWRQQNIIVKDSYGNINKLGTALNGAKTAISGLISGAVGLYTVHESMKNLSTEGANLANILGLVTGSLSTIASGVQIGAIFGPWGAVIGGATGALLTLISAMNGYQTETDKMIAKSQESSKNINEYLKSIDSEKDAIQENLNANLALTKSHSILVSELENIVDANGNVKDGYEERVNYILTTLKNAYGIESELINGQISNYSTLIEKIKKTIEYKNAEILADASKEQYANDLKNETELWAKKEEAIKEYNKLQEKYNKLKEESLEYYKKNKHLITTAYGKAITFEEYFESKIDANVDGLKDLRTEIGNAETTMTNATNEYTENITRQAQYSNLQEAIMTGNYDKINDAVEQFTNSYTENGEIIKLSLGERIKKEQENADIVLKLYKEKYGNDIPEELKKSAETSLNVVLDGLTEQTKEIQDGEISKELADAWYTLGETNKDKFLEKFKELPSDIRQNVVNKMQDEGYDISAELQKGIDQMDTTIKVKADTSGAKNTINNWVNGLKNTFLGFGFSSVGGGGFRANGGIYYNGNWENIRQYANGGAPSHGSMFIAGERGAEIVGHINGRTEVLNQSQIASAIYNAMVSAMSQYGGQSSEIDVHVHTDEGTVIDRIEQRTKQTGVFPFTIPTY